MIVIGIKFGYFTKLGQAQKDAEFYKAAYLHCEHALENARKEIERLKGEMKYGCKNPRR